MRLKYSKAFLVRCLRKARKIRQSPTSARNRSNYKIIIVAKHKLKQKFSRKLVLN